MNQATKAQAEYDRELPFWAVVGWAMLQPISGLITIVLTFKDAAVMIWRNRKS